MKTRIRIACLALVVTGLQASGKAGLMAGSAAIEIGSASGEPGDVVSIDAALRSEVPLYAFENTISFPSETQIVACTGNQELFPTGEVQSAFSPQGCVAGTDCSAIRVVGIRVFSTEPIPDGARLYSCEVQIAVTASAGVYPLDNSEGQGAGEDSAVIELMTVDGSVTVESPLATPTQTPVPPQSTATASPGSTDDILPTEVPTASVSQDDDGCQIADTGSASTPWPLFILAAVAALGRRRHQTSPQRNVR